MSGKDPIVGLAPLICPGRSVQSKPNAPRAARGSPGTVGGGSVPHAAAIYHSSEHRKEEKKQQSSRHVRLFLVDRKEVDRVFVWSLCFVHAMGGVVTMHLVGTL